METRIFHLILLCLALSRAGALQVAIPQAEYEFARGDNITLPCKFTPKNAVNSLVIVIWTADGDNPQDPQSTILSYYSNPEKTDIKSKYEGRASLDKDIARGKADLKLSSITLADNRRFECRVQIPGDDEGKLSDSTRLVVLVAPSKPDCEIQGKAEFGQNINLTCKSEEGSPPPTYSWQSHDVRNTPRPHQARTTSKNGILSLYNISSETSGYYICTSRNKIRSATCNVTLAVMPPSMNIGSTAGIIGGVVAALIALIIIIYCCCCRKKGKKDEEYTMAPVEEGQYNDKEPVRNGERHHDDRQDDVRSDYDDSRSPADGHDRYDERYESDRRDYDDRRSDYDDRRSDYNDRRSDYDDRRSDYSDRRERYDDRRYDDDRRHDERRDRRYDDDRYDDDRYDEPYDDRDRAPSVPPNKPSRVDYDD